MRFRFDKLDWKSLRENKKLKLDIGLAVVIILFFVFFIDIVFTICKYRTVIEERPVKETVIKKPEVSTKKKEKKTRAPGRIEARVAIILDDAGGKVPDYKRIYSIKEPLTLSVIPDLPTSGNVAKMSADAGFEVILHLPMESYNEIYTRRDSGMVICSDSEDDITRTVKGDFSSVKWAVGFNNHMGSKATSDERVMKTVFNSIKGNGVYFIDSRTSDRSVACKVAKNMGLLCAENDVFLDGEPSKSYIEGKFRQLISIARRKGSAIGIGHATRPETVSTLKELMPEYSESGIKFVYASELVK